MSIRSLNVKFLGALLPIFMLACAVFTTQTAFAQSVTTGEVVGTVSDPTGAVVTNSKVTIKSDATAETHTATTGSAGDYRFSLLRPGAYTLTFSAPGFQDTTQHATVNLGQVATVNVQLGIQASTQTVNVTEAAALTQSDNANLATTYDTVQLQNLPAPGNDMTAYAFTAPGVTISTGGGYGNFSAFGLPSTSNLFTINGNDNMDPYLNLNNSGASNLSLGSNEIQEAAVVLNGYTGQYGRQAGANVNYVTKSGTNQFHGNAAWWWNGAALNANDWFNNATGTPRPHAVSNEWADSIGGPIVKNKAFFFFDNEGLRYVLPGGGPVYIPTTAFSNYVLNNLRATNAAAVPFYQTAFNLYAGASGASRATPVTSSIDPTLGCGDLTNAGQFGITQPCAQTFRSTVNNLNTEWLLAAKVDWNISNNDRIYFRYNMDRGVQATGTDPINPIFNANSTQPSYGGQFGYTKVLGTRMVNQLLLSATDYAALFGPTNLSASLQAFPTTFAFNDGLYSNLGGGDYVYPQGRKVRQWQLIDDFSLTMGSHTFKVGTNVRRNWVTSYAYGPLTSGLFTFNSMTDFANGSLANGSTYAQNFSNIGAENLTLYSAGFYGQDEWKIRQNITVTLAARFDRNSNITCAGGCFNELAGQPFGQVNHTATTAYNQVIQTGLHQAFPSVEPVVIEPRVGIAWSLTKSTIIRTGFGIFSDLYQGLIADRLFTNAPAVASFTANSGLVALNNPGSAFATLSNSYNAFRSGFASGATVAQLRSQVPLFSLPNFNTVANELYNPKYYEWNFEIQQGIGKRGVVSVNYVGNHGYQELNQTLFGNAYSAKGFANLPTTAPDPRFGEIRNLNNQGWSNYNGLVTAIRWRFGSSFQGSASYTWSHALDTCSNNCLEPFNALTAVSLRYQISPYSLRSLNYSNADYDVRHSMNANYVWTMPTTWFRNGMMKTVLGGWVAAGTFYFHTGYPFSILNSGVRGNAANSVQNAAGIATQSFLADWRGGSNGYPSCTTPNTNCYGTSQFAPASQQHDFGNIPRNSFRGPNYFDTDLNISKDFAIRERFHMLIGAYFFNILNHPNFDLPVNNVASGVFGQILNTVSAPTSAYGSFQGSAVSGRVIQSQVKFTF